MRRITEEEVIMSLWAGGASCEKIANLYNREVYEIYKFLEGKGVRFATNEKDERVGHVGTFGIIDAR